MSLILDALNKADQERSEINPVPNLQASHTMVHMPRQLPKTVVILAVVGLALLITLVVVLRSPAPVPTSPSQALVGVESTAEPAATSTKSVVSSSLSLDKPLSANLQAASTAPQSPTENNRPTVALITGAVEPGPGTGSNSITSNEVRSLYQNLPAALAQAPEEPLPQTTVATTIPEVQAPAELAASVQKALPALVASEALYQDVPLINHLGNQARQSIPSINFSLHVYSELPGASFVKLNNQMYKAGAQIGSGLRLVDISKRFIVLDYQGLRFKMLSLNSWVNI